MSRGLPVSIYVVTDGKAEMYAFRRWTHIPRVGDTVELQRDGKWELADVTHVRWGSESPSDLDDQRVVLFVEWK